MALSASEKFPVDIWLSDSVKSVLADVARVLQCHFDLARMEENDVNGRNSWPFATALALANNEQTSELSINGSHEGVYTTLEIKEKGLAFQKDLIDELHAKFARLEPPIPEPIVSRLFQFLEHLI
jgi:hypothetical protein